MPDPQTGVTTNAQQPVDAVTGGMAWGTPLQVAAALIAVTAAAPASAEKQVSERIDLVFHRKIARSSIHDEAVKEVFVQVRPAFPMPTVSRRCGTQLSIILHGSVLGPVLTERERRR